MDGVDFRILAALHQDGLLSQAALGRRVGLTAPAVANRLKLLQDSGIFRGFRADIHPAVFGRQSTMLVFPGPFAESDVTRALEAENVIWVAWKMNGGMTVMTYGDSDLRAFGQPAATIPGDHRAASSLTPVSRRVLAAVIDDPRAGRDVLARRTGLSPKTCAKHRDAAIAREELSILPVLGALAGEGALVYHAAVFGKGRAGAVGAALQQAVLVNETPDVQYWFCMAPDYASTMMRQDAVRSLGVDVRVTMNRRLVQNNDRLRSWLNEV